MKHGLAAALTRDDFATAMSDLGPGPESGMGSGNVSRETLDRLQLLIDLLVKWQKTINLVGPSTLADPWRRHILDSAQLLPYLSHPHLHSNPTMDPIADLGAGAGFPGIVLSILGVPNLTLIESDSRKAAFMREAVRMTQAPAKVLNKRVEAVTDSFSIIVSRALAPLDKLLILARPILSSPGFCVFPKGEGADRELTAAAERWKFNSVETFASLTDPNGTILRLTDPHLQDPS